VGDGVQPVRELVALVVLRHEVRALPVAREREIDGRR
jgi:hypothetical protein